MNDEDTNLNLIIPTWDFFTFPISYTLFWPALAMSLVICALTIMIIMSHCYRTSNKWIGKRMSILILFNLCSNFVLVVCFIMALACNKATDYAEALAELYLSCSLIALKNYYFRAVQCIARQK